MTTLEGDPLKSVSTIEVGALAGPSDVIVLRFHAEEDSAKTDLKASGGSERTVFALSQRQAQALAKQLHDSLRWMEDKPAEMLH